MLRGPVRLRLISENYSRRLSIFRVFTQPGSKTEMATPKSDFRHTPGSGHCPPAASRSAIHSNPSVRRIGSRDALTFRRFVWGHNRLAETLRFTRKECGPLSQTTSHRSRAYFSYTARGQRH